MKVIHNYRFRGGLIQITIVPSFIAVLVTVFEEMSMFECVGRIVGRPEYRRGRVTAGTHFCDPRKQKMVQFKQPHQNDWCFMFTAVMTVYLQ